MIAAASSHCGLTHGEKASTRPIDGEVLHTTGLLTQKDQKIIEACCRSRRTMSPMFATSTGESAKTRLRRWGQREQGDEVR